MVKHFAIAAVAVMAVAISSGHAQAQTFGGGMARGGSHSLGSPTVSPYLNLQTVDAFGITGGYQTLVKPFVDGRKASNANSAAISRLQGQVGGGGGGGGSRGGAPNQYFMNYSHYYPGASGR